MRDVFQQTHGHALEQVTRLVWNAYLRYLPPIMIEISTLPVNYRHRQTTTQVSSQRIKERDSRHPARPYGVERSALWT